MKQIGITQRLTEIKEHGEIRDTLDVRWAQLFQELNYLPVVLPTFFDIPQMLSNKAINGIILTGGNDLSDFSNNHLAFIRDKFEKNLIQFALSNDIPIFGVCRGAQIIASYFGATFTPVKSHTAVSHKLVVNQQSAYKELLSNLKTVNSYHNFAIKSVSEEFVVSARAQDATIEAIEHKKKRIFGQMWHPERTEPFCNHEISLIKAILE